MIHVFSKDEVYKADIGIESILSGDQLHQLLKNGSATYDFAVPSDLEDGIFLENEGRILIPGTDRDYLEMYIKKVKTSKTDHQKRVRTFASSAHDLNADYVRPITFDAKSPKYMLSQVLLGSRWEVGDVASVGVQTLNFNDYPTMLKAVLAIKDAFGLEVRFRVEFDGDVITGRYVDLLEKRGQDEGKEFEYAHNITGLKKETSSTEVYSGVIGLGKTDTNGNYLTFKGIELSKDSGDIADKPSGQDYWINKSAEQKWGRKIGKFKDTSIKDPRELFRKSFEWVNKQISLNTKFTVDVALLSSFLGLDVEDIGVGDTYGVKDLSMVPEVLMKSRIMELTTSLVEPSKGKAVLGDYVRVKKSESAIIQEMQSQLDYSRGILSGKTEKYEGNTPPNDKNVIWIDTSDSENIIWKTWSETDQMWKAGPSGPQGVPGPPGEDGQSLYTWIKYADDSQGNGMVDAPDGKPYIGLAYNRKNPTESSDPSQYTWAKIEGPQGDQGIQGPPGEDGQPRYTWIKYADDANGNGLSNSPDGKAYLGISYNHLNQTESDDPADYTFSKIEGPQGPQGEQGPQGIQGPPGDDGQSLFTWVKYADDNSGNGMANVPDGKAYIGLSYNQTTQTESNDPSDYNWSKIKGEQGIQGPSGEDGTTYYTWIKYADSPTSGMSDDPSGKEYMGIAYNKTSPTESSSYSDYSWSLVKGPKGEQGPQGPEGPQGIQGPPGEDGKPRYTWIRYADDANGNGMSNFPDGKEFIGLAHNKLTATESTNASDYTWSKIEGPQGPKGNTGPEGPQGPEGP
ncbi:phage tail spike protein [Tuberibacillus sp. Marseille-P3662]|uniref:phage tail spike protein n=1 Tax=Tuberibacillus sp. Marseille-P3662 TaxID=1965358 RepID=UPI00159364E2|nr:phage tail spike protein [Tuberibacillus sp. Marseille-P3662]